VAGSTAKEWLERWLADRRIAGWIGVIAAIAPAPALFGGRVADDWVHVAKRAGFSWARALGERPLGDWFTFGTGRPADIDVLRRAGVYPWFTYDHFLVSFFRPLSALTHVLDDALWPANPVLMHAHSIVWYALLAWVALRAYRAIAPGGGARDAAVAAGATLLYVVTPGHALPVAWLANRNAIVSATFALATVALHVHARRGSRRAAWLAPLVFGVGLLSGEGALAATAYLFAFAACLDHAPRARRFLALAPYAAITLAWRALYDHLAYGVFGSALYIDPLREPAAYLAALPGRLAALLLAQAAFVPSDAWLVKPELVPYATLGAAVVLAGVALALVPLLRRDPRARFFALSTLLATLPATLTAPSDRLLLIPSFGSTGLVALFIASALRGGRETNARPTRAARALAAYWVATRAVLAPLVFPLAAAALLFARGVVRDLGEGIAVPEHGTLVVLGARYVLEPTLAWMLPGTHGELESGHLPRLRVLTAGASHVDVAAVDDHTLRLASAEGLVGDVTALLLRGHDHPMAPGDVVDLGDARITVLAVDAARGPTAILCRFTVRVDDPSVVFVRWDGARYVRVAARDLAPLPAPGGEHS
jgi:hypothetical protein